MEYIAIVFIAVALVVFVTYPLFGRQRRLHELDDMFDFGDTKQLNFLTVKKARIEENLRELDFEHEMGKLSEQDYSALREGYVKEIDEITKALDRLRVKEEIEELIEGEVRSRRRIK
jgi:hypothetical protein